MTARISELSSQRARSVEENEELVELLYEGFEK